ncbi:hypothetical protein K3F48_13815 [Methylosinus sp. Sm6]|nr:hypothetical protein [Methylosinus sp. Sm6]
MDWFERLTGFRELDYESTRSNLAVEGARLRSLINGKSFAIGDLELASLHSLRGRAQSAGAPSGQLKVSVVTGDVRELMRRPEYSGALFQVASQFNMLEMTSPEITPEHGVTRYQHDHTQGPACAIAAGAATIYRNYFAPAGDSYGQTRDRQLDGLAAVGEALSVATGRPVNKLWRMQNGYALCSADGLNAIADCLASSNGQESDSLRGELRIGLHRDVEVIDGAGERRPLVSQAFCSALPVAYSSVPTPLWRPFASLVLEAAYEATLWSAVLNVNRGASNIVLLTSLGGGAFGNDASWIDDAIRRALELMAGYDLDVRIVSYGAPPETLLRLVRAFQQES